MIHHCPGSSTSLDNAHQTSTLYPSVLHAPPDAAQPFAFFPLTSLDSVESLLVPHYQGVARNVLEEADLTFNQTLMCQQSLGSAIELDPVPYAVSGSFAVNLWVSTDVGDPPVGLQWLFTHTNDASVAIGLPNQAG